MVFRYQQQGGFSKPRKKKQGTRTLQKLHRSSGRRK